MNGDIRHIRLKALVRRLGWRVYDSVPGKYETWTPSSDADYENDSEFEVLVPTNPDTVDYSRLIERAIHNVRSHLGQPELRLMDSYLFAGNERYDRAEWRAESGTAAGSIPWKTGMQLLAGAQRQLSAAAKATLAPGERVYGKQKQHVAESFMRSTHMGQTLVGSYIVSALTPRDHVLVEPQNGPGPLDPGLIEGAPRALTNGLVIDTLGKALTTLEESIKEYKQDHKPGVFLEAVAYGVSRDLVQALLATVSRAEVEISILQGPDWQKQRSDVCFGPGESESLKSAESALTHNQLPPPQSFVGIVELLQRKGYNRIRFNTKIDGKDRVVLADLASEQYETAIEAHKQNAHATIRGRLTGLRTKMPTITDVESVRIVETETEIPW